MAITARDIHEHFVSIGPWVDWQGRTPDGFKFGDPDTPVRAIAVGWQSLQSALEEAEGLGCNLFITHEPTFYAHMDDDEAVKETPPGRAKRAVLERTGMVVYRCHDVWDIYPRLGIVDAWGEFLGLGEPVGASASTTCTRCPAHPPGSWRGASPPGCNPSATIRTVHRQAVADGEPHGHRHGGHHPGARDGGDGRRRGAPHRRRDEHLAGGPVADLGAGDHREPQHRRGRASGAGRLPRERYPECRCTMWTTCNVQVHATGTPRPGHPHAAGDPGRLPPVHPRGYTLRPMAADENLGVPRGDEPLELLGEVGEEWFEKTFSSDPGTTPRSSRSSGRASGRWPRRRPGTRRIRARTWAWCTGSAPSI